MKSIKLTKSQEKKLLKMCKVLFPDNYDKEDCYVDDNGFLQLWELDSKKSNNVRNGVEIHWFEFCTTQIFPKLNQWYNAHQLADFLYQTIGNSKGYKPNECNKFPHPIDYLYEQFTEKVKNNGKFFK